MMRAGTTATFDQRVDDLLAHAADVARLALANVLVLFSTANVGGVGFDDLACAAHRRGVLIGHRFTDTVRKEPCRLVGNAQLAMQLVRADASVSYTHLRAH